MRNSNKQWNKHREGITPLPITAYSTVTACGAGARSLYAALISGINALKKPSLFEVDFPTFVGEIEEAILPQLDNKLERFTTRNTRIALAAINHEADGLRAAIEKAVRVYGADRVGVVIGTSTSGVYETENAYWNIEHHGRPPSNYDFIHQHIWVATAKFLQLELGLRGPCYTISTACSSSSKSIASAQRLIDSGVCDAVLAGGVDSLCRTTCFGFKSLDLVAEEPCTPLDQNRSGISLGEGAGLLLLERPSAEFSNCIHLCGTGESSDAYHMTAPHPEGRGAVAAMRDALTQSGANPGDIDYVNLHATGTLKNDAAEVLATETVFGADIRCSATKGLTGHTLGAAGGVEAIISCLALTHAFIPGTCGLRHADESFHCHITKESKINTQVNMAMSNNFGFGGNNSSLIFRRRHA